MYHNQHLIIFDGRCNLCNGVVGWLMRRGMQDRFLFVPFRSETGQRLLEELGMPQERLDTVILIDPDGVHTQSDGFIRMIKHVPGWSLPANMLKLVPRAMRNAVYNKASYYRLRLFGQASNCVIPY